MGQVHHGSATTTAAIRRAIQHSQESLRALAKRHGVNQKTVAKWRKRTSDADLPTGPREPRSTVLSIEEEAVVVAFRRHTLLPLDDCLYALQPTIPHLTRSSLHRCLQRHGISRLPDTGGSKPQRSRFKRYPIGFFHLDIAEVRTEQGKLHLFVAIDRTSKFAFAELHEKATRRVAGDFLRRLVAAVPYKINTVLTDNGTHFTDPTGDGWTPEDIRAMRAEGVAFRCHSFEAACADLDIEHRLTKPRHPWTNGQVERMNRTIKDATVKRFHYASHDQLRQHLADFVAAYNFGRRLKTLKGLTPYEFTCQCWTKEPAGSPSTRSTKCRDRTSSGAGERFQPAATSPASGCRWRRASPAQLVGGLVRRLHLVQRQRGERVERLIQVRAGVGLHLDRHADAPHRGGEALQPDQAFVEPVAGPVAGCESAPKRGPTPL
jgi:transposase InsO family protein